MSSLLTEPNADYVTAFEDIEDLAGISHNGQPNRPIATTAKSGLNSFTAVTEVVQWGEWNGEAAVLLVWSMNFVWELGSNDRIDKASIKITLEQVEGPGLARPIDFDPDNDPIVRRIGPEKWESVINSKARAPITWTVSPELSIGPASGRLGSLQSEWRRDDVRSSMKLQGNKTADDARRDFNGAVWQLSEDKLRRTGILDNFRVALVAQIPKSPPRPFVARVSISANIAAWLPRRLRSKNDAPIFLDRMTSKPLGNLPTYGKANQDFADKSFPWAALGLDPAVATPA